VVLYHWNTPIAWSKVFNKNPCIPITFRDTPTRWQILRILAHISEISVQRFALLESKVVLSSLLRRYKFELSSYAKTTIPSYHVVLKSLTGINLVVSQRWRPLNRYNYQRFPALFCVSRRPGTVSKLNFNFGRALTKNLLIIPKLLSLYETDWYCFLLLVLQNNRRHTTTN
jgi:hypothetical protein